MSLQLTGIKSACSPHLHLEQACQTTTWPCPSDVPHSPLSDWHTLKQEGWHVLPRARRVFTVINHCVVLCKCHSAWWEEDKKNGELESRITPAIMCSSHCIVKKKPTGLNQIPLFFTWTIVSGKDIELQTSGIRTQHAHSHPSVLVITGYMDLGRERLMQGLLPGESFSWGVRFLTLLVSHNHLLDSPSLASVAYNHS